MPDLIALKAANSRRWANAKPTRNFAGVAARLVTAKPQISDRFGKNRRSLAFHCGGP